MLIGAWLSSNQSRARYSGRGLRRDSKHGRGFLGALPRWAGSEAGFSQSEPGWAAVGVVKGRCLCGRVFPRGVAAVGGLSGWLQPIRARPDLGGRGHSRLGHRFDSRLRQLLARQELGAPPSSLRAPPPSWARPDLPAPWHPASFAPCCWPACSVVHCKLGVSGEWFWGARGRPWVGVGVGVSSWRLFFGGGDPQTCPAPCNFPPLAFNSWCKPDLISTLHPLPALHSLSVCRALPGSKFIPGRRPVCWEGGREGEV